MYSIYALLLIVFPIIVLWKIEIVSKTDKSALLEKSDTVFLRGVSAFCVIAAHYLAWIEATGQYYVNSIISKVIGQLGGIGVLVFFFVSGYGIYESYAKRIVDRNYVVKRVKSVYFPYIFMKFVFLVVEVGLIHEKINFMDRVISILKIEDWFIHVIVIQYIVFYVAAKIKKEKLILISICVDCVLTGIYIYMDKPIRWFNALWLFAFGMLVSKYQEILIEKAKKYYFGILGISALSFAISGMIFALNKGIGWANLFKPLSGVFLCVCICLLLQKCRVQSVIVVWAGYRSMQLYIVHIAMWKYLVFVENVVVRFWGGLVLSFVATEGLYRITRYIINAEYGELVKKSLKNVAH